MKRRWLPENVTRYRQKGRWYYRFRKTGLPTYHFQHAPGTPQFLEEYRRACDALPPPPAPRFDAGSVDSLCEAFYRSPRWQSMKPSSQRTYRGIIERWRAKHGGKPVARLETRHVLDWLYQMRDRPAAANNLRKALNRLFRFAVGLQMIERNPVEATDSYEIASEGFHAWSEVEIEQYQARWPLGTRERLALELMLWTALRRSDVVLLGRQHRRRDDQGDLLMLRHGKNKSNVVLPIGPPLAAAIDAMDSNAERHLTYLVTEFGKPFTAPGFGNWFRSRCDMAGLPQCSAHGLRKAMSRRLAETGATANQGRAVTGHKSDRMFAHYSASAAQDKLAEAGLANVVTKFAKPKG